MALSVPKITFINTCKYLIRLGYVVLSLCGIGMAQHQSKLIQLSRVFNVNSRTASDSLGITWISDQDGLYKFDGYEFKKLAFAKIFGTDFKNRSMSLFEKDKRGNFWIATANGDLVKMASNGQLTDYSKLIGRKAVNTAASNLQFIFFGTTTGELWAVDMFSSKLEKILKLPATKPLGASVQSMALSEKGDLYISTVESKVYRYAIAQKKISKLDLPIDGGTAEKLLLTNDNRNRLWISTEYHGLFCYEPMNQQVKQFGERGDDNNEYMMYRDIHCDREGTIWLATDGYGLRRLDPNSGNITVYKHQIGNIYSLNNNTVRYINSDENGNIWLVLKGGIIQVLSYSRYPIRSYSGLPNHIPHRVLSILKTKDNSLWIGSDGSGLSKISPKGNRQHFDEQRGFHGRFIQALAEDKSGNIWIGTYQNGLFRYDKASGSMVEVQLGRSLGISFLKDFRNIFVDSKGRIWANSTYGIHILNEEGKVLADFPYHIKNGTEAIADAVFQDRDGKIWVAFSHGILTQFVEYPGNLRKSTFAQVDYHRNENKAPWYYNITQICQDKAGALWFRCDGGFIIRFDPGKQTYRSYEHHVGLDNIDITSLLLDDEGLLWLGSRNGVHQFDPVRERILNYSMYDGLNDNLFIRKSAFRAADGELFFGGSNGVSSFYAKNLSLKPITAHLLINNIQVLNKSYEELGDRNSQRIEQIRELKLLANQSSFSISFAAIGNLLNTNYRYQYRLKGFEDNFSLPSESRTATYTNLPPGRYTFEVIAAQQGSDLFAVGPLSLDIYIAHYWWQSWPAKTAYVLFLLAIVYFTWRWLGLRSKLHREEINRHREKELYAMKMNFFAKISHEIQTPLSLIIGPLETLFSKSEQSDKVWAESPELYMIKNNAERLSRIVTELTHVRDNEIGKLRLSKKEADLVFHLKTIAISFDQLAKQKGIRFRSVLPETSLMMDYDYLKIEHVIYNLIGNAIKFTPVDGTVDLRLKVDEACHQVSIIVSDSGPGMDEDTAAHVFDIFYQGQMGIDSGGLGIGLALSKEIVQLHDGRLTLTSMMGHGCSFEMILPLGIKRAAQDQVQLEVNLPKIKGAAFRNVQPISGKEILIVEDNLDMQLFLKEVLGEQFNVSLAHHGMEAIAVLKAKPVDLILSDVMMPVMDGVQLAEKLFTDPANRHIPIILMTAFPSDTNRQKGLMFGTLAYLSKPFLPSDLLLLIENVLAKQQDAIMHYKNKIIAMPPEGDSKLAKSDLFLLKLTQILKEKIADPTFLLEDLEGLLHMSYSVIFKRCQETTGFTPLEYFRRIKIKKAATLLVCNNYSVSEAAFEVGFNDSKYFSRLFKEIIGETPSVFKGRVSKDELANFLLKF